MIGDEYKAKTNKIKKKKKLNDVKLTTCLRRRQSAKYVYLATLLRCILVRVGVTINIDRI